MDFTEFHLHVVSLFVLFGIFAFYLWLVLDVGPKFMEKREPFNVSFLIRLYNIFQVICCSLFLIGGYRLGFTFERFLRCETFSFLSDTDRLVIKIGCWLFLLLRVFEFSETFLFVLRKKQSQASFLHIFHHIGSVLMTWLFLASGAELMGAYIAILNSTVHIVMYSYYFLSSYRNQSIQAFVKLVKPVITIIQLIQFLFIIAECVIAVLPNCHASFFFHVQIANFIVLFALFGRFFVRTYLRAIK